MPSPQIPDRFQILETLFESGSKSLLRAFDKTLHREVLLQVPGHALGFRAGDNDRALREARVLARIRHPGVNTLLDVLVTREGPILVLEPLSGTTLAERLERDGKLPPETVRRIGIGVAEAADAVHAVGGVHRSIAEHNVILDDQDNPVLIGFEFSKPVGNVPQSSIDYRRGSGKPLPSYPAPEQIRGEAAGPRSDIFSLGCVLYRALTGTPAFPEGVMVTWQKPQDPRPLSPGAPPEVPEAIRKCLEESPARRFETMTMLADALRAPVAKTIDGDGPAPRPRRERVPILAALGVLATLVVAIVVTQVRSPSGTRGTPLGGGAPTPESGRVMGAYKDTYDASHALLIGIDYKKSEFRSLSNAERDVKAIRDRLLELGWSTENIVTLLGGEASHRNIIEALGNLANRTGPDDQVFVYYAGHGEASPYTQKSGWAIPADAEPSTQAGIEGTNWLVFDRFENVFDDCEAKHILIALDCCHSGAAVTRAGSGLERVYRERYLTEVAHQLIASSRPNEKAWDGEDSHSPFAQTFLKALEMAREDPVTSTKINSLVQDRLAGEGFAQSPILSDHRDSQGDFVFLRLAPVAPDSLSGH